MKKTGLALLAMLLVACGSSQTAYMPAGEGEYGYTETMLSDNRYRITFTGNTATDSETVQDYALLRAAELTLQKGNDWFQIADRNTESESTGGSATTIVQRGAPISQTSCGLLGCTTRYSSAYTGLAIETPQRERQRYTSQLEIVMGQDEPEEPTSVYDARQLADSIRARMNDEN